MKTKLFLSALTLGAMMTTFVACDKEEPYVDPGKVIESEVVDPGTAEEVEETDNGTEGICIFCHVIVFFLFFGSFFICSCSCMHVHNNMIP